MKRMKTLIFFLLAVWGFATCQRPSDIRKPLRIVYGGDTLLIRASDSVQFTTSGDFYNFDRPLLVNGDTIGGETQRFLSKLGVDTIRFNGSDSIIMFQDGYGNLVFEVAGTVFYMSSNTTESAFQSDQVYVDSIRIGTTWVAEGDIGGTGTIGGTAVSGRMVYGTGTNTIGNEAGFEYNPSTNILTIAAITLTESSTNRIKFGTGSANIGGVADTVYLNGTVDISKDIRWRKYTGLTGDYFLKWNGVTKKIDTTTVASSLDTAAVVGIVQDVMDTALFSVDIVEDLNADTLISKNGSGFGWAPTAEFGGDVDSLGNPANGQIMFWQDPNKIAGDVSLRYRGDSLVATGMAYAYMGVGNPVNTQLLLSDDNAVLSANAGRVEIINDVVFLSGLGIVANDSLYLDYLGVDGIQDVWLTLSSTQAIDTGRTETTPPGWVLTWHEMPTLGQYMADVQAGELGWYWRDKQGQIHHDHNLWSFGPMKTRAVTLSALEMTWKWMLDAQQAAVEEKEQREILENRIVILEAQVAELIRQANAK